MMSLFGFSTEDLNCDIQTAGVLDSQEPDMPLRAASEIFIFGISMYLLGLYDIKRLQIAGSSGSYL